MEDDRIRQGPPVLKGLVIMPFDEAFDDIYQSIQFAAGRVGHPQQAVRVECRRLDHQGSITPRITTALETAIAEADFCVADLSPKDPAHPNSVNPNVMWEIGYAMALRKPVFLVSSQNELPFDVRDVKHITYRRDRLSQTLSNPLKERLEIEVPALLSRQSVPPGRQSPVPDNGEEVRSLREVVDQLRDLIAQLVQGSGAIRGTVDLQGRANRNSNPDHGQVESLAGAWYNEESGSYAYMAIVDGKPVAAYCYGGDRELSGYYSDWQLRNDWYFARFWWVDAPDIHGFSFLKRKTPDRLIGAWWYDSDIDGDPRLTRPDIDSGFASNWVRLPGRPFPGWASSFLEDVKRRGLPRPSDRK